MNWTHHHPIIVTLFVSFWIGVFGFVVLRFPKSFAKMDITYGVKWPSSILLIRAIGSISVLFAIIMAVISLGPWRA